MKASLSTGRKFSLDAADEIRNEIPQFDCVGSLISHYMKDGGGLRLRQPFEGTRSHDLDKISDALVDLDLPEITELVFENTDWKSNSSILLLLLYIMMPDMRSDLESEFPQIPFDSINTKKKLFDYIGEIIKSGSNCIRKVRLFAIGHQGAGKSSLLHSIKYLLYNQAKRFFNMNLL